MEKFNRRSRLKEFSRPLSSWQIAAAFATTLGILALPSGLSALRHHGMTLTQTQIAAAPKP